MNLYPSEYCKDNQVPTSYVIPEYVGNDCLDCMELASSVGIEVIDWQAFVLEAWMGYGLDGKWTAKVGGNCVPRQNGKTLGIQLRAMAEMLFYGGDVIYTSQLQKTSTETFHEMSRWFETKQLRKYLAPNGIRTALGREEIRLKSGARIKFLARTRNGGDGQHGSLLVFDEAQALDSQAQESFLYAISATQTERGSQTIYNGTPPKDGDFGLAFEKIRNSALDGKTRTTAWTEWGAGYGGRVPDTLDRGLWRRTNPSFGILIAEETIEAEAEQATDPEKFAHQRLGWWTGQRAAQILIGEDEWKALGSDSPDVWDKLAYGVRFSGDGAVVALSVALLTDYGAHVEFIRQEPTSGGIQWLVDWLSERKSIPSLIAIDGRSAADDLRVRLEAAGVKRKAIKLATPEFAINATSMMVNMVADKQVTHCPDAALDASATKSVKRRIGTSGGYGFAGEESEIIDSACLALYAVKTTKRNPNRKAVVW